MGVASAFIIDIRLGITAWTVAAVQEVPQELGDFGLLVRAGWRKGAALAFNFGSALAFLAGGYAALAPSGGLDVDALIPFAAGDFPCIAAADLIPRFTAEKTAARNLAATVCFITGLGVLYLLAIPK